MCPNAANALPFFRQPPDVFLSIMPRLPAYHPLSAYFCILLCALLLSLLNPALHAQSTADSAEVLMPVQDAAMRMQEIPIGSLRIEGSASATEAELRELCDSAPGSVFSEQALQQDIARMLDFYDRRGYPFAAIRIADVELRSAADSTCMDIRLEVHEGRVFRIEEITVEGNTLTDADVIIRETRIDEGEIYDGDKIGDIRRRLERLQYFASVREPQLYVRDDSVGGLLISVEEGSTNRFDGVVGYQPAAGEEGSGYFTGLVDVQFGNLFGTGRQLSARWEKATQESSELELHYLEPWIMGFPVNIAAGFFQRQQDSAYVRRAADGEIRLLASSDISISATLQATEVIPSVNSAIAGLYRSSILAAGLQLRIDTRDDVYNPRSGIVLRNAYSGGNKRFTAGDGSGVTDFLQHIEIDAGYYQEILPRVVAAIALHGRELTGDELDVSDLYRIGGANTLRGYREEQFSGTRFVWINNELRYSLGRRTFAFAFFDFGYIYQSPDIARGREEMTAFRNGYGLGARIETGLGIVGVSYALGHGDGLSEGKIHFGLINAF
ncbi:BamA/TamA family outer membrane protein [bacterium]|nr:BamA/TamA family outer membrane protein [bacterium]